MILVWHYGTGVVLDGNSLKWQISVQALKIIENKIPTGDPKKSCGHAGAPNKRCELTRRYLFKRCGPQIHSLECKEARARGNVYG